MDRAVPAFDEHSVIVRRFVPHAAFLRDAHAADVAVHDSGRQPMQHKLGKSEPHKPAQRFRGKSVSPKIGTYDIANLRRIVIEIKFGKAAGADHFAGILFHKRKIVKILFPILPLEIAQIFFCELGRLVRRP